MVINKVVVAWPDFKGQLFKGSRGLCHADKASVKIVPPLLGKSSWCERVLYSEVLQISSCLWSYKKRGNCNHWLNTTNLQAFFILQYLKISHSLWQIHKVSDASTFFCNNSNCVIFQLDILCSKSQSPLWASVSGNSCSDSKCPYLN